MAGLGHEQLVSGHVNVAGLRRIGFGRALQFFIQAIGGLVEEGVASAGRLDRAETQQANSEEREEVATHGYNT